MYVQTRSGVASFHSDIWEAVKNEVTDAVQDRVRERTGVDVSGDVSASDVILSPRVTGAVRRQLSKAKLGEKIGEILGCSVADGFETALPPFLFTSDPKYGVCKAKAGGPSTPPTTAEKFAKDVTQGELRTAAVVAANIAEPRIQARLTPWFVGLPIAGLLIGAGVTYLVMNRTRPKRG